MDNLISGKTEGEMLWGLIENYLLKNKVSKQYLGEVLGITPSRLSRPEHIKKTEILSTETAIRAAAFFNLEKGYFQRQTTKSDHVARKISEMSNVYMANEAAVKYESRNDFLEELKKISIEVSVLNTRLLLLINKFPQHE